MSDPKHNISKDDAFVLFQISKVKAAKHQKAKYHGDYTSQLERAEANGLNKWALKEALRIEAEGEISETVTRLTALMRFLRLLGLPLNSEQLDMFETAPASQPITERAYEQGFGAGVLGEGQHTNPHDDSTEAGQAWLRGWHEGDESRAEMQKQDASQQAEAEAKDDGQADQTDIEDKTEE